MWRYSYDFDRLPKIMAHRKMLKYVYKMFFLFFQIDAIMHTETWGHWPTLWHNRV